LFADEAGATFFTCAGAGSGVEGTACTLNEECAVGLTCFGSTCRRWCASDPNSCGAGQACGGVDQYGGRALGACCQVPAGQACDWATDCGCPSGQTCEDEGGIRFCRAVAPSVAESFGPCSVNADCPALHSCFGGACTPHCNTAADCASPDATCFPIGLVEDPLVPFNGLCSRSCDPIAPQAPLSGFEACNPDQVCLDLFLESGAAFYTCLLPGAVPEGGDCSLDNCEAGLTCIGTCFRYCELGTTCDTGACQTDPPLPPIPELGAGLCPLPE
jgi:hypothetical protein